MSSGSLPGVGRLCAALPKSKYDEQFASLPAGQQLLVLAVTGLVVWIVPPLLVGDAAAPAVGVALGFGALSALSSLLARDNER